MTNKDTLNLTGNPANSFQPDIASSVLGFVQPHMFNFRTVAIYPDIAGVSTAIKLLHKEGFTPEQISLLGREQDNWREKLELEWEVIHTAKDAATGVALGAIPGLVLVTGVAITGGVGLLVAGPMIAALEVLGLGALGGGLLGGAVANLDSTQKPTHIREVIEDAIGRGQWVVVVHSNVENEAKHAQSLLPDSRVVRDPD